jgi:hypothetical protein
MAIGEARHSLHQVRCIELAFAGSEVLRFVDVYVGSLTYTHEMPPVLSKIRKLLIVSALHAVATILGNGPPVDLPGPVVTPVDGIAIRGSLISPAEEQEWQARIRA